MGVHFLFLWSLFAGSWARQVHGAGSFVREIVLQTGLWLPLVFMFLVRGFSFGFERLRAGPFMQTALAPANTPPQGSLDVGSIVSGLYARIVTMHVVILFGAWLTLAAGAERGPIILLVVLKTLADVGLFVFWGPKSEPRAQAARGGG